MSAFIAPSSLAAAWNNSLRFGSPHLMNGYMWFYTAHAQAARARAASQAAWRPHRPQPQTSRRAAALALVLLLATVMTTYAVLTG
jgi:hypothetical protein